MGCGALARRLPWSPVALKEINFALHTVHQVRCIDDGQTEGQEGREGQTWEEGGYSQAQWLFRHVMQFGDQFLYFSKFISAKVAFVVFFTRWITRIKKNLDQQVYGTIAQLLVFLVSVSKVCSFLTDVTLIF